MRDSIRGVVFILLAMAILTSPSFGAVSYRFFILETPRAETSGATAINNKGQVVGVAGDQAVMWENGKATFLGTLGEKSSMAIDINNNGEIIGLASTPPECHNPPRSFFWRNGVMREFGASERGPLIPMSINDKGQVVGCMDHHAFVWDSAKGMRDLAGDTFEATDINGKGQVVGKSNDGAFVWQNDKLTILNDMRGRFTKAAAINDSGLVVGTWTSEKNKLYGFLWKDGKAEGLGTLGSYWTDPHDINDKNQIVGSSAIKQGFEAGSSHAFIWQNGKMEDLNNLIPPDSGWLLYTANGINYAGQIVGSGDFNGKRRAFLLTPQ